MTLKKLLFLIVFASLMVTLIQVGCDELITQQITNQIPGYPLADFSLDSGYVDHSCDTLTVKFKNRSQGEYDQMLWRFGDGDSSTDSNPTHFYSENGLYTVSLRVTNSETENYTVETKSRFILIGTATASFSSTPDFGCAGMTVKFRVDDYDTEHLYRWNFGDNSSRVDTAPEHTYDTAGIYEVFLSVEGDTCGDIYLYDTITVSACPTPLITADITEGCVPLTVNFSDTSVAYDENYIMLPAQSDWNFGDGTILNNTQDPSHTYTTAGVYTVTLTAVSDGGTKIDSFVDYITVHDSTEASFTTVGDSVVCKSSFNQYQLKFINTSSGTIDSTLWRIENSTDTITLMTTDSASIIAIPNPGIYNISMVTYGYCNEDSLTKFNRIFYSESLVGTFDSLVQTLPENSYPDSTYILEYFTSGVVSSWSWNYGDGSAAVNFGNPVEHIYSDTGHFEVILTLRNACDSIQIFDTVIVSPLPVK